MTLNNTNSFSSSEEIKITSVYSGNAFEPTINITSILNNRSSLLQDENTDSPVTANSYNFQNGYGLINAGKAVSKAVGVSPYPDAPKLGGNNWGADLINAPTAWQNGHTGKGVIVAVLDTGIDYNHEDLKNNIWTNTKEIAGNGVDDDGNGYIDDIRGWNFNNNNNNILDNNGHGTHVSGTIAGENNSIGVTGIAYNSQIMAIKVLDEKGSGSYANIANGIRYAVDNGADVINLSLGSNSGNNTVKSAIEYASSKGVIVVMSAGNNGDAAPGYPARYAEKSGIAVGAVDQNNQLTDFSNRSGSQEIKYVTAPGKDIYSTVPDNKYAIYTGTSMAAPHVAGVVALMLSANPNLTESQVKEIIISTAENSTNPQQPEPTNPSPSMPSLFPPLDSFFPIDMIDIGSQFPDIGFQFPGFLQVESTTLLPPVIVSISNENLGVRCDNFEAETSVETLYLQDNYQLVSLVSQSLSRDYDSSGVQYIIVSDDHVYVEEEDLFKKS